MRNLYYRGTDRKVKCGDILTDFRNESGYVAHYFREPTHGEGKITVKRNNFTSEYYVSVFGLEWR